MILCPWNGMGTISKEFQISFEKQQKTYVPKALSATKKSSHVEMQTALCIRINLKCEKSEHSTRQSNGKSWYFIWKVIVCMHSVVRWFDPWTNVTIKIFRSEKKAEDSLHNHFDTIVLSMYSTFRIHALCTLHNQDVIERMIFFCLQSVCSSWSSVYLPDDWRQIRWNGKKKKRRLLATAWTLLYCHQCIGAILNNTNSFKSNCSAIAKRSMLPQLSLLLFAHNFVVIFAIGKGATIRTISLQSLRTRTIRFCASVTE